MAQATQPNKPLSSLFQSETLRRAFERAERDMPPESLAVEPERAPVLTGGATVPALELA